MPLFFLHINEDPSSGISAAEKEEVDSRSIYVGNVRLPPLFFSHVSNLCLCLFQRKVGLQYLVSRNLDADFCLFLCISSN